MAHVNILEAKTDFAQLIKLLETHQEETILIERNGIPVVEMRLAQNASPSKRIGIAKGKLQIPEDFDRWDHEVAGMFEEEI